MVNGDKVWEEGKNVLNLEQVTLPLELHRSLDVFLLLHHMPRCKHTSADTLTLVLTHCNNCWHIVTTADTL